MDRNEYTEANRIAWNETAPRHAQSQLERLLEAFRTPGYSTLDYIEKGILESIGVKDKAVAQLSCNNGRELLSVKGMGAGRCVGFDISEAFIEQAHRLSEASGLEAEFVTTDVYKIPADYDAQFDLVYVTIGALGWLPDLTTYFGIVARLLKPGGRVFIYEMHPMLDMFEGNDEGDPPTLHHSYFRTQPYVETDGMDYYSGESYDSGVSYWFHHKLSDIIDGCLRGGLSLERFQEYDHDISAVFKSFESKRIKPALSYTLVARKASV